MTGAGRRTVATFVNGAAYDSERRAIAC